MNNPVCKGDFQLGTACAQCSRCVDELLDWLNELAGVCEYSHDRCVTHECQRRPCAHDVVRRFLDAREATK